MELPKDTYRTILSNSEGNYKEKGSKFLAYAFRCESEKQIKENLELLRKKHFDARHHAYAYRLGAEKKIFRTNDDGEPSSTAGKPIFGQILSKDITNILIVVVRYFGGTKLGVSGLINAYRSAAADAIDNTQIITKTVNDVFEIKYDYISMNDVMKIIKEEKPEVLEQQFDISCKIVFSIRQSEVEKIVSRFKKIKKLEIMKIKTV
ncbi:MAG: YigZ family protein [Bacteroidetes bacterium]|nr:YigZ family protein [Bacteroidota bacterium]MBT6687171.1 YigZ family protein [Bacteroidota bacterium]MBT7144931.1 YigZ family protein [Bacteroidota bacterium]MBT7492978.1 YigZ family protein [Bacteroidota bacterium]